MTLGRMLARGLGGRCPRCGRGPLFAGFLTVARRCGRCGLGFTEHDSGDGPAVAASLLVGAVVVGLALAAEIAWTPPLWLHFAVWLPLTVAGSVAVLRPLKGALIAAQYRYRAVDERIDDPEY